MDNSGVIAIGPVYHITPTELSWLQQNETVEAHIYNIVDRNDYTYTVVDSYAHGLCVHLKERE